MTKARKWYDQSAGTLGCFEALGKAGRGAMRKILFIELVVEMQDGKEKSLIIAGVI
jgi:hypothetical protein